ncbi:hypothetical protein M422DRAFT_251430 [Sphaerobolus stellatus SS14]|uniref:DUF7704 domain-containing protein n=1 Tax=Sphaerobolus stellatus (strain SS14) TaxID=990650 RepID=A0A0C9W178_SPHS4|nr:hypothetical protein M422DRAFT_251430 [Sphaerobolus stellatus SS14]
MTSKAFPALPGFYKLLFLHLEPISTISPAFLAWVFPGAAWFHSELIPSIDGGSKVLDARSTMAIWQLANCYFLLGLISSLVFRAVRDALPHDPVAQEKIVRASLTALAIADVSHVGLSFYGLPSEVRANPSSWNSMTHGNVTFTTFLFLVRVSWLLGIGRKTYSQTNYAQAAKSKAKAK